MVDSPTIQTPEQYYIEENLRNIHARLNAGVDADTFVMRPEIRLRMDSDKGNRHPFSAFCTSPIATAELDHFLERSKRKRRLLDIGSLVGAFSFAFTSQAGREALAVEPAPGALRMLRRNCLLNPDHNIRILDMAAGSSEGSIPMRFDWIHLMAVNPDQEHQGKVEQIKVQSVDTIVFDQRFHPDVVKIDVEGYEKEVLTGMQKTIEYLRPDIHMEVHGSFLKDLGHSVEEIFDLLTRAGYSITQVDITPLRLQPQKMSKADFEYYMRTHMHLYCVHEFDGWCHRLGVTSPSM